MLCRFVRELVSVINILIYKPSVATPRCSAAVEPSPLHLAGAANSQGLAVPRDCAHNSPAQGRCRQRLACDHACGANAGPSRLWLPRAAPHAPNRARLCFPLLWNPAHYTSQVQHTRKKSKDSRFHVIGLRSQFSGAGSLPSEARL